MQVVVTKTESGHELFINRKTGKAALVKPGNWPGSWMYTSLTDDAFAVGFASSRVHVIHDVERLIGP